MRCTQPGCTGTIVDGYCDVCGMPGAVAPAGRGVPGSRPSTRPTGACRQPGCAGRIVDGYCDVCGAPDAPPGLPSAPASPGSTVTRTSIHLGSTALGSARATSFGGRPKRQSNNDRLTTGRIGAGLTRVPPAPAIDPGKAVLARAEVPLGSRVCARCGRKVGQGADKVESRSEGFCPGCGAPYSFTVKLHAGDLVGHQYEVIGALAHGGLGWIYLAQDRNVSDRWVVLKGLLNSGDPDALAAAIGEQQFLAQVEHPLIVEIYNFVTHDDAGYIVMEYVGGRSLKQLLKQRMSANGGEATTRSRWTRRSRSARDPAGLRVPARPRPALLRLQARQRHPGRRRAQADRPRRSPARRRRGFRHLRHVGYQAPEVATLGPSIASDIYTDRTYPDGAQRGVPRLPDRRT